MANRFSGSNSGVPFVDPNVGRRVYEYDYFSGSQIGIYVGDVFVDDIASISFEIAQNKAPIYGYSSRFYDAIAEGTVIVQGELFVNYKEQGYLWAILDRYHSKLQSANEKDKVRNAATRRTIEQLLQDERRLLDGTGATLDEALAAVDEGLYKGGLPSGSEPIDIFNLYKDLAALEDDAFEDVAERFEYIIWDKDQKDFEQGNALIDPSVQTERKYAEDAGQLSQFRRPDQFPPFDIWITYGDITNPRANSTLTKLIGVSLTGSSQTIQISGEPILERYTFFAKNRV